MMIMVANSKLLFGQSFSLITNNESFGFNDYSFRQFDVFSFSGNPFTIMNENDVSIGLFSERKFMLSELSISKICISTETTKGNIGVMATHGGTNDYAENEFSICYARSLSENLKVGIGFDYLTRMIKSLSPEKAIGSVVGFDIFISSQMQAGVSLHNPAKIFVLNTRHSSLKYKYEFGFGYDATKKFNLHMHAIKEEDNPTNIIIGFQYQPVKKFNCKVGITSMTKSIYIGAGIRIKQLMCNFQLVNHPQLGACPAIFISSNLSRKNGVND